jgi:trimethylamine:corrinoid methyltransferase-like protein
VPIPAVARRRAIRVSSPGKEATIPKFVIERDIPGAGTLSSRELQAISQKSCGVLRELGPQIQWVQSYVTDDKIYCG